MTNATHLVTYTQKYTHDDTKAQAIIRKPMHTGRPIQTHTHTYTHTHTHIHTRTHARTRAHLHTQRNTQRRTF